MRHILVQQKISKAKGKFHEPTTVEQQLEANELAYTSIILHLYDVVVRKVGHLNSQKNCETNWKKKIFSYKIFNK